MSSLLGLVDVKGTEPWSTIAPDLSRTARSWLSFKRDPLGQTYIDRQRTEYPFHMTKPFSLGADPEGMLTLYLQSSSGGLYRGDKLTLDVDIEEKAAVHLTTQASTVVHHAREGETSQTTNLRVGADSFFEYLPDPLILFTGADMRTDIRAVVEPGATLFLVDGFTTHDPEGRDIPFKKLKSELRIETSDGELLALDRFEIEGSTFVSGNSALQGGQRNHGSVVLVAPGDLSLVVDKLRVSIDSTPGVYGGVSLLPNNRGVWCRILADDGIALSVAIKNAWIAVRTELCGSPPSERRK